MDGNRRLIPNGISFLFFMTRFNHELRRGRGILTGQSPFYSTGEVYRDATYCCDCFNPLFGLRLLA
ncbi:hypothetical protein QFZ77_004286 [Paenibacillus sp. V4I3]|nr:hypothetical protein [Paenibacillus sp. V4I3]